MSFFDNLPTLASTALLLVALIALLGLMWLARAPAKRLILALSRALYGLLRQLARLLRRTGDRVWRHSHRLTLAQTRQRLARACARDFTRIGTFVERGLGGYPALEQRITLQVNRLEEDYQHTTAVPPPPPDWLDTLESVTNLQVKARHQGLIEKNLEDIRLMAEEQQRESLRHYRQTMAERHNLLKRMLPAWRRLARGTERLGEHLREITQCAHRIDQRMDTWRQLEQSEAGLNLEAQLSRLGQLLLAVAALVVLGLAAQVNYQLLVGILPDNPEAPLAVSVGFGAGLWLALQLLLGWLLLELLQMTGLIPGLGELSRTSRRVGLALCAGLLTVLALLASVLVWHSGSWALADNLSPLARQQAGLVLALNTALAMILPLVLLVSALALETCLNLLRPLAGYLLGGSLQVCAALVYWLAHLCRRAGPLLVLGYELLVSPFVLLAARRHHPAPEDPVTALVPPEPVQPERTGRRARAVET